MDIFWDGVTKAEMLSELAVQVRNSLADAAKTYDWPRVLKLLSQHPQLINTTRLDGLSRYAPLHQVAHGGAPVEIAERMIKMLAWRTLRNSRGERPVDVALRRGNQHLLEVLDPVFKHHVPVEVLLKIQSHFHAVIRKRIDEPLSDHRLRLPELEVMLESERPQLWFPVPGMYGGFKFWLETTGTEAKLVSESWCRVVEGSGERHEITSEASRLVDEGFV